MFGLTAYAEIITGQFLLSLGALFYTGWWLTAFRPDARSGGPSRPCFSCSLQSLAFPAPP